MEHPVDHKIPDDEIDFKSLGKRVRSILIYPFALLASNRTTLIIFVAAAIVLAISSKFLIPKTYKSSFVVRPSDIYDKLYPRVLADIPVLIKQHDLEGLGETLQLNSQAVASISDISFLNFSFKNVADSLNFLEVVIKTTDYNQFIPIQNAILNYLENNPYYLKIKNLQKEQIAIAMQQVNSDLLKLDSLKSLQLRDNEKQVTPTTLLLKNLINPADVYTVAAERIEKKSKLLAQLTFLDRFQLIKSCVVTKVHNSPPRILIVCFYLIPLSVFLCCIFLLSRQSFRGKRP